MDLEPIKKFFKSQNFKYGSIFPISLTIFILSLLSYRSANNNDSDEVKRAISIINKWTAALTAFSLVFVLYSGYVLYKLINIGKYEEYSKINNIYAYTLLSLGLLVTVSVQYHYISLILPDMNDKNAVTNYDNTHRLSASSVNNISNTLLGLSIVLFIFCLLYVVYKRVNPDDVNITKETQYDKVMKVLKQQLSNEERELNDAIKNKTASDAWVEDRKQEIERIKLSILGIKRSREESVQKETSNLTNKLSTETQALNKAQERTIDEINVMQGASVNVEQIVPSHLKKNPTQPTLTRVPTLKVTTDILKPTGASSPSTAQSTSTKLTSGKYDSEEKEIAAKLQLLRVQKEADEAKKKFEEGKLTLQEIKDDPTRLKIENQQLKERLERLERERSKPAGQATDGQPTDGQPARLLTPLVR